jgi:hypothetical protein
MECRHNRTHCPICDREARERAEKLSAAQQTPAITCAGCSGNVVNAGCRIRWAGSAAMPQKAGFDPAIHISRPRRAAE